ncbi:MAG: metallophosphatase [Sumerlaeia bacterium]
MMNRRSFLRNSLFAFGGAALAGPMALAQESRPSMGKRLIFLHTNDVHSHLNPRSSGPYAGLGGAPQRASLIKAMRARAAANGDALLVVDCGDIFQGTPYFNLFEGEPDIKAMNAMGIQASTIGNHEFDAGIERLAEMAQLADFPFLNCNYDWTGTPMEGLTHESVVHEFDGLRVGLLGVGISLDGLVSARLYGDTKYLDPVENARRVARRLRQDEGCDFVACISHASFSGRGDEPGDRDIAREVPEIDIVMGGHDHDLYDTPRRIERPGGSLGWVNQAGWAGTHMGMVAFDVFGPGQREMAQAGPVAVRA